MSYEVVEADSLNHQDEVIRLWEKNFEDLISPEKRFFWISKLNPYGPAKFWLLRSGRDGKFVGTASLIPRRICIDGSYLMAGIVADTVMNKEHRTLGPALMLQRAVISECERGFADVIIGFPNKFSEAVNLRTGYKITDRYVKATKFIRSYRKLVTMSNKSTAKLISPILDTALNLDRFYYLDKATKLSFECVEGFDGRFDTLWRKLPKEKLVIGERSQSYLNWRYVLHPYVRFKVFSAFEGNGDLLGYIVFSLQDNRASIYDILCLRKHIIILGEFLKECRKRSVECVEMYLAHDNMLSRILKRYIFLKRETTGNVVFYKVNKKRWDVTGETSAWYLAYGDTDV